MTAAADVPVCGRSDIYAVQKLSLGIVELSGKIHVDLVGIEETLGLIPESLLLLAAVSGDLLDGRRSILALSVDEDRL